MRASFGIGLLALGLMAVRAWASPINDDGGGMSGSVAGAGDPNRADLLYDPVTGNVKIDSTESPGGVFTAYYLSNGTCSPGRLRPENLA